MRLLLPFLLLVATPAFAETYEQAFVACSEQVDASGGDLATCMKEKGFTLQGEDAEPAQ